MKKVLFATTALVMTAGVAAAEVAISGDGRMGVIYDGDDVQFASRARVKFTLTGESDAGLSFGGEFRVDQEDWNNSYRSAARGERGAVWISGTYGKLSMGDVVSASEAAIGDLYEIGYTDGAVAGDPEEISYLVGDGANRDQGPTILYEYTVNQISFYASATDGVDTSVYDVTTGANTYTPTGNPDTDALSDHVAYSLAAKYDAGNWWAALGYAKHDDMSEISLGGEAKFNNFSVKGVFVKYDDVFVGTGAEFDSTIGLSAAYQADALTVKGFFRQDKVDVYGASDIKPRAIGIGADYDLGGGAVLAGGIINVDSDVAGVDDDTYADVGVKFKF
ncbi:porin [Paracoccus kondratievae]|uniref:Porin n=1 Tax=Paracoccus kondratievae TaxID=135740 RepID=A0AAD3P540_9RHOB|nr:porin [Paracoccus kondratievae]GLK66243.1 porin [Paracoccus kondratievae]